MICCSRLLSVVSVRGSSGSSSTTNSTPFALGHVAERALDVVVQVGEPQLADVEHDRARLDLRQIENVVDQHQQVVARRVNRLGVVGLLAARDCRRGSSTSWSDRISKLLSGVRSSCDMFARNSVLYFDVRASCSAFSSSACRACSTSWFFRSTSTF